MATLNVVFARRAKRAGANYSLRIILECRRAGVPLSWGFALIHQESDFRNVFGSDPTIFIGAGVVTAATYRSYKARRGPTGKGGMQGVGPAQLTWWEFQDRADRLGGCHVPRHNIRVGVELLRSLRSRHGSWQAAARAYNSGNPSPTGPGARYGREISIKQQRWHRVLTAKG